MSKKKNRAASRGALFEAILGFHSAVRKHSRPLAPGEKTVYNNQKEQREIAYRTIQERTGLKKWQILLIGGVVFAVCVFLLLLFVIGR